MVSALLLLWFTSLPAPAEANVFDRYLTTDIPPADGFDVPSNGRKGPVRAIGTGRVTSATADRVTVTHVFYENHERLQLNSQVWLTSVDVSVGAIVRRGQVLGQRSKEDVEDGLRLELQTKSGPKAVEPRTFIRAHRRLFVPQDEPVLVLVDQASHRLRIYENGEMSADVEVGFGQAPGRKRKQGDLRTPRGMYFVVHKYRGKFSGPVGPYYGGHWIKVNYPNAYDADYGREHGLITKAQARKISRVWKKRKLTNQKTRLGGGIGFHGWAGAWSWDDTGWLTWGCVVFHNPDIRRLFDRIPKETMVVFL